ncbi:MAG: zinc-ribbon domain-containing protein [Chloroflexi bacterium]|nr:zinc-ribbon domain-containing protein [Chloroflexota bacterium]
MYCSSCGEKIPDDSKFCPECGSALKKISAVLRTEQANSTRNLMTSVPKAFLGARKC